MKAVLQKVSEHRKHKININSHHSAGKSPASSLFSGNDNLSIQRKPTCPCGGGCPRCCNDNSIKTELPLQRSFENQASPSTVPPIVHEVLRSPGNPLDQGTRAFMRSRFGYDFGQVRVHKDAKAAKSARAVNALAYTVGRDLVFGAGQFAPRTEAGKKLLSHELAHVMQQGGKVFDPKSALHVAAQDDVIERQAKAVSADSSNGAIWLASSAQGAGFLQRTVGDDGSQTIGTKDSEDECTGWFADYESTSKRAAEHYVRTELAGDRGVAEKIECDLFNPDTGAFACTVYFTDGTPIRVIVRKDVIIVGVYPLQSMHPPPDQPLCWYDYKCPGPNRELVMTKRKCQTSKPARGTPSPKAHGPEP